MDRSHQDSATFGVPSTFCFLRTSFLAMIQRLNPTSTMMTTTRLTTTMTYRRRPPVVAMSNIVGRKVVCSRLLTIPLALLLIIIETTTSTNPTAITHLDFSYLFRTKSSSIATAVQDCYQQLCHPEQLKQRPIEEECVVELDVTSSLMGKNMTEILEAAFCKPPASLLLPPQTSSTTFLRLTAKRNQWTSQEGTAILQYLLDIKQHESGHPSSDLNNDEEAIDDVTKQHNSDSSTSQTSDDANTTATTIYDTTENPDYALGNTGTRSTTNDTVNGTKSHTSMIDNIELDEEGVSPSAWFPRKPAFVMQSLDLGWNFLGGGTSRNVKGFHLALQRLLSSSQMCPHALKLEVCGLGPPACRAIAKGIVLRYSRNQNDDHEEKTIGQLPTPLSLHLACNEAIGDGGVAALAAAIRTIASQLHQRKRDDESTSEDDQQPNNESQSIDDNNVTIFETLDMSACSITDAGVEALAVAMEGHPLCVKHLDLSNNQITDEGAITLARALRVKNGRGQSGKLLTLDLSNNKGIGDRGAKELSEAFQDGLVHNMILRSCHLHADGAACFGRALRALGNRNKTSNVQQHLAIDLSGNPLGILRRNLKSGSKYSASALKSKATETTVAYMNMIGKTFQKGLKDLGLADGGQGVDSLESDDEEEERMGKNGDENDESKNKCGGIALAEAFIVEEEEENSEKVSPSSYLDVSLHIRLGLRHCSFDTRAAEALAAVFQESRKKPLSLNLTLDMKMNAVLEDDVIEALQSEAGYEEKISNMAERYLDAVEVFREAQERAMEATRIARARARADAEMEEAWGSPVGVRAADDGYYHGGDAWDSDGDSDLLEDDDGAYFS
jgi:hypothetical protein